MTYDPDRTEQVPEPSPQSTPPAPAAATAEQPPAAEPPGAEPPGTESPAAAESAGTVPAASRSWRGRPSKRVAILIAAVALVGACCIGAAGVAIGAALFHGDAHGPVSRDFDRGEYGPGDSRHPGDMRHRGGVPGPRDMGPGWRGDDWRPPAAPPADPAPASPAPSAPTQPSATAQPSATT